NGDDVVGGRLLLCRGGSGTLRLRLRLGLVMHLDLDLAVALLLVVDDLDDHALDGVARMLLLARDGFRSQRRGLGGGREPENQRTCEEQSEQTHWTPPTRVYG